MSLHPTATVRRRTLPGSRAVFAAAAAVLLAATVFEAAKHGLWLPAILGLLAPDLPLFAGGGKDLEKGQLHRRAVPAYNAAHRFIGPCVLLVAAALGVLGLGWFVAGLAWATHIAVDRAVGYGLRTADGLQRD